MWSIKSTNSLFHGISSATVTGNLPYFEILYVGKYTIINFHLDVIYVPVQNTYESLFPFNPLLEGRIYVQP